MGTPDMRTPISFALGYPDRISTNVEKLNLGKIKKLTFYEPDFKKFPCLELAYDSLKLKKSAPTILNAANEIAVENFLKKNIKFDDIVKTIKKTIYRFNHIEVKTLKDILSVDYEARLLTNKIVKKND